MYGLIRWFIRLLPVLLVGWAAQAQTTIPEPEYLTVRNGLPQGFVKSMLQDRHGFIWLATRDGLCRYDGVRFRVYTHDTQQPKSLSFSSVFDIKEDRQGFLWIRTENNNIDRFDPITEQFHHVSNSAAFRQALNRDQIVSIYPDQRNNVWIATQTNGFFRLDANGSVSQHTWNRRGDTTQRVLRSLLIDRRGELWLAAQDGLFRYTPQTGAVVGFRKAQGLPQNDVFRLHERVNGELILGFPGRFTLFDPAKGVARQTITLPDGRADRLPAFARDAEGNDYANQYRYTDQNGLTAFPTDVKLNRFQAISVLVDRSNALWIGTDGDGIIKYDLNKRPFSARPYVSNFHTDWLSQVLNIPVSALPVRIRQQWAYELRYQFDRRKALWVAGPTLEPYRYVPAKQSFEVVKPTGIEPRWLPDGQFRLMTLATGAQGELWGLLGPDGRAVVRHNPDLQTFTAFPLPLPANHPYTILAMAVDGGRIYLATQNHGLLRADLPTKRLVRWHANGRLPNALPNDALLSLAQDPLQYNHLWIGTYGSGLCRLDKLTGQIRSFTGRHGLPNNVVYGIRPDGKGNLWLSTNRGLCRFDTRTFEVRRFSTDDGLPGEEFNRFHDLSLPDGRLVFGGIGGYTIFDPRRISEDQFRPVVALTALRINNQLVNALTPGSPINQDINATQRLELKHNQNFLSFDFAALQFNQSDKNQYRYKLIGLDNDWVYSGNQATATYTNLPPATYTFMVNASNTSGLWSSHTRQLQIVINPPIWATWWAYGLYLLLVVGAIALFLRVRIHRVRLQSQVELREKESIQLKHLDEVKTRFFANITHEFRTPLTLILTPLEEMLRTTSDQQQHSRLALVYRNANRLLRLINELLDLAKLDAGQLTITPTPDNLSEFMQRMVLPFAEEAQRKRIQLHTQTDLTRPYYWFDTDKLEKIINNLLSNALKFTPEGGTVSVRLSVQPTHLLPDAADAPTHRLHLIVQDTGIGIATEKLPHIFNRFYQVSTALDGAAGGSGIGLALVKELVEAMHGSIGVASQVGVGTSFTLELPLRSAQSVSVTAELPGQLIRAMAKEAAQADQTAARLLIVEDNDDIAQYLTDILRTEWRVKRASNGREGVEVAIADGPDLIISDVLMPELNGYELCQQLKANSVTSHIPIILLTAKTAVESRVEGLSAGADDYVAKPFQVEELRGRVRNRLEQQQRMRQHYRTQLLREGHLPTASPNPQDDFMNRVYAVLETRLDDPSFGVEPLAMAVGLSRMHLNRKIKALTGMSPNELIRAVRLNHAAELLLTGVSVSEVADRVGFDTPAYFSKVFKEQYHLTPSDYVEKHRSEVV